MRLIIWMLGFDLALLACDLIMVIRRFTTFTAFRAILSSVSFAIGLMIQLDFVMYVNRDNKTF